LEGLQFASAANLASFFRPISHRVSQQFFFVGALQIAPPKYWPWKRYGHVTSHLSLARYSLDFAPSMLGKKVKNMLPHGGLVIGGDSPW